MVQQFPDLGQSVPIVTADELKRRLDAGESLTLLDTRRPADYEAWQITHPNLAVVNVPFMEFLDDSGEEPAGSVPAGVTGGPLVTSCAKGISSTYVAEFLQFHDIAAYALEDGMEGWARLYDHDQIPTNWANASVFQFHRPSSGCLSYLLLSEDEAAVIDPLRAFVDEYITVANAQDAELVYAIDTHVHADHVSGLQELVAQTPGEPVMPAGATDRGLSFEATLLEDGETLTIGDRELLTRGLPGHTTEMTGYEFGGVLVTGDSLFLDGVARPDLEDEAAAAEAASTLWDTLQDLKELDEELLIAPGHVGHDHSTADGPFTASLGALREDLRAFSESRSDFVERITSNLPPQPSNFERIIDINLGRDSADSEESFELELGPNNCAVAD